MAMVTSQIKTTRQRSNVGMGQACDATPVPKSSAACGFFEVWDPFASGFASMWLSCRDTLCSLPEDHSCSSLLSNHSNRRRVAPNVFLDPCCHTIQHNDSMSTATPREIDPEKIYTGKVDALAALDNMTTREEESCNSSISSKDIRGPANRNNPKWKGVMPPTVPPSEIDTSG